MIIHRLYLSLSHGPKYNIFKSHAIKQRLHGSWGTLHPRHDMHTQQRSVHALHQQVPGAFPYAELQSFCRMLQCFANCNRWRRFACGDRCDICKAIRYCNCRTWHRTFHTIVPKLILAPIEHTFTQSTNQILKFPDHIGIFKCRKWSPNISTNTFLSTYYVDLWYTHRTRWQLS